MLLDNLDSKLLGKIVGDKGVTKGDDGVTLTDEGMIRAGQDL